MKIKPAFFTLFFFISCGVPEKVHISKTIQFEGRIYLLKSDDPFTGILYNNYANGKKEYEGEYEDGRPHGSLVYWYDNGIKLREGELKNGSPSGRWIYYNQDGSIKETRDF